MIIKKEEECYFGQMNFVAYCESCRKRFVVYDVDHRSHAENCGESVRYCPFCGCIFTHKNYNNNEKEDLKNIIDIENKRISRRNQIITDLRNSNKSLKKEIDYLKNISNTVYWEKYGKEYKTLYDELWLEVSKLKKEIDNLIQANRTLFLEKCELIERTKILQYVIIPLINI